MYIHTYVKYSYSTRINLYFIHKTRLVRNDILTSDKQAKKTIQLVVSSNTQNKNDILYHYQSTLVHVCMFMCVCVYLRVAAVMYFPVYSSDGTSNY